MGQHTTHVVKRSRVLILSSYEVEERSYPAMTWVFTEGGSGSTSPLLKPNGLTCWHTVYSRSWGQRSCHTHPSSTPSATPSPLHPIFCAVSGWAGVHLPGVPLRWQAGLRGRLGRRELFPLLQQGRWVTVSCSQSPVPGMLIQPWGHDVNCQRVYYNHTCFPYKFSQVKVPVCQNTDPMIAHFMTFKSTVFCQV